MANGEVFICSDRSARNMAYQGFFKETGVVEKLFSVTGDELIGLPLKAPNAV